MKLCWQLLYSCKFLVLWPNTHLFDLSVQQLALTVVGTGHLSILTVHYCPLQTLPEQEHTHIHKTQMYKCIKC